jgi:hypothetical protein
MFRDMTVSYGYEIDQDACFVRVRIPCGKYPSEMAQYIARLISIEIARIFTARMYEAL